MKKVLIGLLVSLVAVTAQAQDIMVSWTSNGVLQAEGMEPGTTCDVEWTQDLQDSFNTNNPSFRGLTVDSNGMVQVEIPMFFRVSGTPKAPPPPPSNMVLIPAGTNSGTDPEVGVYSLVVTNAFFMDITQVTKAQWDTVYNWAIANGYSFDNAGSGKAPDHPVHTANWYDFVKWCNARSEMTGRVPCYTVSGSTYKTGQSEPDCDFDVNGYRLPTSDEWEYAARGGLSGKRFPWGDTIMHSQANYESFGTFTYDISPTTGYHPDYRSGGFPYTSPVGSFQANGYGLYDMAGNLFDWCWSLGSRRVFLGGDWTNDSRYALCGQKNSAYPTVTYYCIGFRTVCYP